MVSTRHADHVLRETFRKIKRDMLEVLSGISQLRDDIAGLKAADLELSEQLIDLNARLNEVKGLAGSRTNKVKIVRGKSSSFVAAKGGKKFHRPSCPFAKNILPKQKVTFKTKDAALNNGYKECRCLA